MKNEFKFLQLFVITAFFFLHPHNSLAQQGAQIWITEIQVAKPDSGVSTPFYTPEVHLYEAGIDSFLACAGRLNRLGCAAMAYDLFYSVLSSFKNSDSTFLTFGEIESKNLYLQVIANNDTNACPARAGVPPDLLLGTSAPFAANILGSSTVLQFGKVTHLRIGTMIVRTPPANSPLVKVKEIEVTGVSDGIGKLEIEVHLYQQETEAFLGCSGQINGLRDVDHSGEFYRVDARFHRPFYGPDLTYQDVIDKNVYIVVIEDDSNPCPCANDDIFGPDDLVAKTGPFPGAELVAKEIKNVRDLKRLFISVEGIPPRVTLLTPSDFSRVTESNPAFTWQSPDTNIVQYQFQLAADSMMVNLIVDATTADTTTTVAGNLLSQNFYWWHVRAKNALGWGLYGKRNIFFYLGAPSAVEAPVTSPAEFSLIQNYPNPFNPETTIEYAIPAQISGPTHVILRIYNLHGQLVRTLVKGNKAPGQHRVLWDGRDDAGAHLASGVYHYSIVAGDFRATRRMAMLK